MSATETATTSHASADAHGDHAAHGEFIAHHFDSPQQQFDSGKLGIWLFLVTEILFFSGLFCAYTLYRAHHPEIFVQASLFLDKVLGGINTIVLLFSSLTMALAVRSAQLAENRKVTWYLTLTMVCAALFLGIKAVEYSHKWDEGIFVRAYFNFHEHGGPPTLSPYLVAISIPFAICLIASLAGAVGARLTGKANLSLFLFCVAIMFGGYFLGAIGGKVYMNAKSAGEQKALAGVHMEGEPAADEHAQADAGQPATGEHASGEEAGHESAADQRSAALHGPVLDHDIGIFFSIYYCMTGLHAFHVIGGMIALSWLLWRSINNHWRPDYFGPVDFVGLYWHLVDLIWIFLFPLLYLIN